MIRKTWKYAKNTSENDKLILDHFVVISYDQSGKIFDEAKSDIHVVAHMQKPYEIILLTASALLELATSRLYVGLVSFL